MAEKKQKISSELSTEEIQEITISGNSGITEKKSG